jgi:hypothetical protein
MNYGAGRRVIGWMVNSWKQVEWRKNKECEAERKCKKGIRGVIYVRVVYMKDVIDVQKQNCRLGCPVQLHYLLKDAESND